MLSNSLTFPLFLVLSRRPGRSLTKSQRMCHTYIFSQQEVVAYSQTWRGSTENLGNVGRLTTWARTSLRILPRGWSLLLVNTKIPHMCQFWFRLIVVPRGPVLLRAGHNLWVWKYLTIIYPSGGEQWEIFTLSLWGSMIIQCSSQPPLRCIIVLVLYIPNHWIASNTKSNYIFWSLLAHIHLFCKPVNIGGFSEFK